MAQIINFQAYKLKRQLEKLKEAAGRQAQNRDGDYDLEMTMSEYRRRETDKAIHRAKNNKKITEKLKNK